MLSIRASHHIFLYLNFQSDFHYELTECDAATGGRWRVSVPAAGTCTGGAPSAPIRLSQCCNISRLYVRLLKIINAFSILIALTCPSGEYFDMEELECRDCPPGTYSLGGMIRHDGPWDRFPNGFTTFVEPLTSRSSFSMLERERFSTNCSRFYTSKPLLMILMY